MFSCGEWHEVEVLFASNGTTVFIDGASAGTHGGRRTGQTVRVSFEPRWGELDQLKAQDDYLRFDHIRFAVGEP